VRGDPRPEKEAKGEERKPKQGKAGRRRGQIKEEKKKQEGGLRKRPEDNPEWAEKVGSLT